MFKSKDPDINLAKITNFLCILRSQFFYSTKQSRDFVKHGMY